MADPPRWKLRIFQSGKFRDILVHNPKKGIQAQRKLESQGIRAHLICRRFPHFSPKGVPDDVDMLWCPYCRRWRWFGVPRRVMVYKNLEVRCCKWCGISEFDYYVTTYNATWYERKTRKRRKNRNKRRKTRR